MKTKEEIFDWLIRQRWIRSYCDSFLKAHPSESIEMFLLRMEESGISPTEWFGISIGHDDSWAQAEKEYLDWLRTPNKREKRNRVNNLLWISICIIIMVCCAFVWKGYTVASFLASLCVHGGGCGVAWFICREIINRNF